MKYSDFSERAYAVGASRGGTVPVQALGEIYADFGHRYRLDQPIVPGRSDLPLMDLGIGTYFACAPEIIEAGVMALRSGHTRYETVAPLKAAICDKFLNEHGMALGDTNVLLLGGARPGMALTLLAGINPGDRIAIPDPDYIGLTHMASALGAEVIRVPMARAADGSLSLDLPRVETLAGEGLAAIILTNPNNPTGNVLTRAELSELSAISERHGTLIMVNEIYDKLVHDGPFVSYAAVGNPENSVVVGGTSKSYEMTGFGIGWLVSSAANVAQMEDLAFLTHQSKPDAVSQYAALAALSPAIRDSSPARARATLRANALATRAALDGHEACLCPLPAAGQFAFPFVDADDRELARFLLREMALQVVPGSVWGAMGKGHLRLALANSPEHQAEGLSRLRQGLSLFRKRG